ncbi:MAG: hypothetical protein HZB59_03330 [Ignavibacteriales bacterium]|nr:hypothetical protein [Ignavibacteriales bacterium]
MVDNNIQRKSRYSGSTAAIATILSSIISGLLGVGLGVTMARISPDDKFSWAGLAVFPLWFILEITFELFIGIFGSYSKIARITVTTVVLLGFHIAWFSVR